MKVVVDSSAILALLWQEPGHEKVLALMDDAIVSTVNLAEVFSKCTERGIDTAAVRKLFVALAVKVLPFDEQHAAMAGDLRKETRQFGLSLGDRACLATASAEKCQVVTADKAWMNVKVGVSVIVVR